MYNYLMATFWKNYLLYVWVITVLLMPTSWAQRPSFAGSRPPNGLNQKDKYLSTSPQNADIANRFGSANFSIITNKIAFGQPQKPPVGYPVVLPETSYTALTPPRPTLTGDTNTSVVFEDRFDNTSSNNNTGASPASPSITLSTTERSGVPLDAHGDQLLINQLYQTPVDKRPFWFINYQAIEAQRNSTVPNSTGA